MRPTPALLATALALTLTGCADGGAGPGPTAAQSASTESGHSETTAASSAQDPTDGVSSSSSADEQSPSSSREQSPSSTPTDTGEPFDPQEFTDRLEAAVKKSPTVHISMELQANGQESASAQGIQDLAKNSLDMDVTMGPQELGYRLVEGNYYLAQPPKWVPVGQDSQDPVIQQTLKQIQILSMRNLLDAFVVGLEAAGVKGRQDIGGVATTHYTATVDSTKTLTELGMDIAPGTPETILYDIWVDDDDLVRKLTFTQNGTTTTMTATDWGKPVTIEQPKPSELAQAPDRGTP